MPQGSDHLLQTWLDAGLDAAEQIARTMLKCEVHSQDVDDQLSPSPIYKSSLQLGDENFQLFVQHPRAISERETRSGNT